MTDAEISEITSSLEQSIKNLPFLERFMTEADAWIFGGFPRFHAECVTSDGYTEEKLFKYLEDSDVDFSCHISRYMFNDDKPNVSKMLRALIVDIAKVGYVEFRGHEYVAFSDGYESGVMDPEGSSYDISKNMTLPYGVYTFWIPEPRIKSGWVKYDMIIAGYGSAYHETDYYVNRLRFHSKKNGYSMGYRAKEIVEEIKNKKITLSEYSTLKQLYRSKKLWVRGYRPNNIEEFKENWNTVLENSKEKIVDRYVQLKKPVVPTRSKEPPVLIFNRNGLIQLTLEVFHADSIIMEIKEELGL